MLFYVKSPLTEGIFGADGLEVICFDNASINVEVFKVENMLSIWSSLSISFDVKIGAWDLDCVI